MVSAEKNIQVVCFGEVLWDVLPTGKQPGGAPMNVAYHLNRLGISSAVISKVGSDADGRELLDMLRDIGVSPAFIQTDDRHATSRVVATIGGDNEVTYDIIAPVAWDFLVDEPRCSALVREAAVLVYGSLAARNRVSRDTLVQLLDHAAYRMFDVNLRAPHYTRETVDLLMRYADAVKLNGQELAVVSAWFGNTSGDENTAVGVLQDRYGLPEIIVTKGAAGASYYCSDARYDCPAIPVDVADTVGSGDAFLAGFLAQKLRGETGDRMLEFATMLGAYVTTQSGACPPYAQADLDRFAWAKYLERKPLK